MNLTTKKQPVIEGDFLIMQDRHSRRITAFIVAMMVGVSAMTAVARPLDRLPAANGAGDSARFVARAHLLEAPGAPISPLAPFTLLLPTASVDTVCSHRVSLSGPAGAVDIATRCDASRRVITVQPAHDLTPAASYVLFLKRVGAKTSAQLSASFSTMSLPAEPPARVEDAAGAKPDWTPPSDPSGSAWRYEAEPSGVTAAGRLVEDLRAAEGVTALAGHLARMDGTPLAGVAVAIEKHLTQTDAQGRFLLSGVEPGARILKVDGTDVHADGGHFTKHFVHVDVQPHETTRMGDPIYLAKVDPASEVAIASPTDHEVVLTHAAMPGLEVRIPKGIVLREFDGSIVRKLSLTPVPVDRAPYPVPAQFSIYFTLQPGGAFVDSAARDSVQVIYPNYGRLVAKAAVDLWNYDPQSGWKVYGHGRISDDAKTVVADGGFQLKEMMTFGFGTSPSAPNSKSPVPNGTKGGDPIDVATGVFTYHRTDIAIADVMPISIDRVYQQTDSDLHPFGIGMNFGYSMMLWIPPNTSEIDLVLSDGTRVPFQQVSTDVYRCSTVPGEWNGATLSHFVNPDTAYTHHNQFKLTMRDQSMMLFDGDFPNRVLEVHDVNGNVMRLTYDSSWRFSRITSPSGRYIDFTYTGNVITQLKDSAGRTVTYTYDAAGTRLLNVLDPDQTVLPAAQQALTQYGYDAKGRLYTVTDKRNKVILTNLYYTDGSYVDGWIKSQTLADQTSWTYTYSPSQQGTTGFAQWTQVKNPNGWTTQYSFNTKGYVTGVIAAQNATAPYAAQSYTINRDPATNNVLLVADPLGRWTEFHYDAYGSVDSATRYAPGRVLLARESYLSDPNTGQLLSETNAVNAITQYSRDNAGNLIGVVDPLQRVSQINRNGYGLPEQFIDALGHTLNVGYSGADATSFSDSYGRTGSLTYDALGRMDSSTDALGNTTTYQRDAIDNIVTATDPLNNPAQIVRNPNGSINTLQRPGHTGLITYGYDDRGRLNSATDELQRSWSAKIDGNGNVTQYTDERAKTTNYRFDPFDRPDTFTFHDGSTLKYQFDAGNRLMSVTDSATGTVSFTPDPLDHITKVVTPVGSVGYTPDALGRVKTIVYPSGLNVVRVYDDADQLKTLTVGSDQPFTAVYEDNGRLKTLTLPNAAVRTQTYIDPGDDLGAISYADASGQAIGNWAYAYDGVGRLQNVSGSFFTPVQPTNLTGQYDDGDQLANNGGTTVNSAKDGSQIDDVGVTFSYDVRGRMAGSTKGTAPSNVVTTYSYNAIGQRDTKQVVDNTGSTPVTTVTHYIYDLGNHLIAETDGSGATQFEYVWFGDMPVMVRIFNGTKVAEYLIYTDRQNTPRRITDFNNAMRWIWDSDPYGNGAPNQNPSGLGGLSFHLRFPGQIIDNETGMFHNGARDYNPKTGRYLQVDPQGLAGGSMNMHAYVGGDPINFVDPSGMWVTSVDAACAQDPEFCSEIMGQSIENAGRASGDPCVEEKANQAAKQVREAGSVLQVLGLAAAAAKKVPNPWGRKGGPAHQKKVQDIVQDIESRGYEAQTEHTVPTPGGSKSSRAVDVVAKDSDGNVVEYHQVGRQTGSGDPVARERRALDDVEQATGTRPEFHPYN